MIVIDDRLLSEANESEFWLLMHLTKRLKENNNECWPSNKVLMEDTKWGETKYKQVKKDCIEKGFITCSENFDKHGRQKSNVYEVVTDKMFFVKSFKGISGKMKDDGGVEKQPGGGSKNNPVEGVKKQPPIRGVEKQPPHYIEQDIQKEQVLPPKATKEERKIAFEKSLVPFLEKYDKETLRAFADYWTESNENGKKMRFEMQKVFDKARRLATWQSRNNTFKPKPSQQEPPARANFTIPQHYVRTQ